jgi:DNA repair protein RadC
MKKLTPSKTSINRKNEIASWRHPGGKFVRLGPEHCTDSELIAILIGSGVQGKTAEQIAEEILKTYQSFRGLANQPINKLIKIKGLKKVKAVRIAAAFEIARRIVKEVIKKNG